MVGGGGGGRWVDTSTSFAKNVCWFFLLIVYCLETPKFAIITNWLQLNAFTVWKSCGYSRLVQEAKVRPQVTRRIRNLDLLGLNYTIV